MDIETFYNTIAYEFDKTRVSLWNCVKNYLDTFEKNSLSGNLTAFFGI